MPEFVLRAEYARRRGWNKSTATRYAQAGKLVLTDDGLVDVEASDRLIESLADPAKTGVAERHARERADKVINGQLAIDVQPKKPTVTAPAGAAGAHGYAAGVSGDAAPASSDRAEFLAAQAAKERELANLARIKREELEGVLVRKDDVKRFQENIATIVSKGLTGMTPRVMPLINGEPDPAAREQILEREISAVLTEFADAALAMSAPPQ